MIPCLPFNALRINTVMTRTNNLSKLSQTENGETGERRVAKWSLIPAAHKPYGYIKLMSSGVEKSHQ